jgi:hypothetical protein
VRSQAAPLVMSALAVAIVLGGCSGSSSSPQGATSNQSESVGTATTTPSPIDPHAARAIDQAAVVMGRMQAYRFVADEQISAATRLRTHLAGSVVRGQGLAYRLTVGGKTTQVVRLRSATYVRVVPHRWSRLQHSRRLVDPTATLLQILHGLRPTGLATSHGFTAVHGTLPPPAARAAGLPATRPAEVTVTIDPHGRVVAVDLRTTTQVSEREVTVRLRTSYEAFGDVGAIRRPV